jgi:hypothetical protein
MGRPRHGSVNDYIFSILFKVRPATTEPPYFTNPINNDRICPSATSRAR